MSQRSSRGTRIYQQEIINEGDEEEECPDGEVDQFQREYQTEPNRGFSGSSGRPNERPFRTSGLVTYSPDDDNIPLSADGYQGGGMSLPEDNSSGRRPPYQPFEVSPDYQPIQYSPENARPVSPRHASYHERNEYSSRSFREQRAEDMDDCEERPPSRPVSPQYRQPASSRDSQYVPGASSNTYGARFRGAYDDAPMNPTSSTVSPYTESTMYREISPFSQSRRDQSGSRKSPFTSDYTEPQNFSPDSLEQQQYCSPDSLEQQNFSPDSLEARNYPSDCPETQNFSPDSLEPRNTSGSPGARVSPDYLQVPRNSPAMRHNYPHRSSLRTPQPNEGDGNEQCGSGGGTYRKPGPEFLSLNTGGSGPNFTPSPAASSAPSYGKFGLSTTPYKGWGTSPPISCVGGTPADSKREALEHLSQLTVTKSGKPNTGGSPKECNREAMAHVSQLTVTKTGNRCVTPKESTREASDQCPPGTVTKSVPPRCKRGLDFGQGVDFSPCDPQAGPSRRLPRKPELSQDEIKELIDSETEDVGCAWLLSTEQKPTYKKPCPKQQKAQMTVKHMVETAQKTKGDPCAKEYPPMLEPEPEDLSPEVAAAMMFSQEQGIKLDSCPDQTIKHLFPSESFQKKPPPSKVSIVDPNQKDKEELMEKSASVPSEGVSDSAYTRTMKQKGGDEIPSQKSYDLDFALGQEKREVVLVPQRPKRFNTIQFRGNLTPWFPGYFSAFPDQADSIKIVPSPSKLFLKAWIMTNPANLPATDIIVIE